jgi:hypothetical protein
MVAGGKPVPPTASELAAKELGNRTKTPGDLKDEAGPIDYRQRFVDWLQAQRGTQDPSHYFDVAAPCYPTPKSRKGKHWCGICLLCGYNETELTKVKWKDGVGFVRDHLGFDQQTRKPQIADTCYIDKPHRHYCGVVKVDLEAGVCWTIGGNEGYPGHVAEPVKRRLDDPRLTFFKIDKWVKAAEARDARDTVPDLGGLSKE